ncbi:hypothetical protein niasHT_029630 [Heterodera trifolii]|uniref:Uncharacterized protein n=1 Tax=Heterodera trifolii TaxID=157864 RepID=A0ABD2JL45_9BILA
MFIAFKNHFLHHQLEQNVKFGIGFSGITIQNPPAKSKQQKIKKIYGIQNNNNNNNIMPIVTLLSVLYVCSVVVQAACAMPMQMLVMYTPSNSYEGSDQLLFPLHRSDLHLFRQKPQEFLANALLSNTDVVYTHPMELVPSSNRNTINNNNNNPYTLMMKRISTPPIFDEEAIDGETLNARTEQKQEEEQNLLRAGRNIEEVTAPKMYARHLGDLGGTMFRFG